MAISVPTVVASAFTATSGTVLTATLTQDISVGDKLIAVGGTAYDSGSAPTGSFTDSEGNPWGTSTNAGATGPSGSLHIAECDVTVQMLNGTDFLTFTTNIAVISRYVTLLLCPGLAAAPSKDTSASGSGTAAGYSSGATATLAQSDELAVSAASVNYSGGTGGNTATGGFTELFDTDNGNGCVLAVEYLITTGTGAVTGTGTWAGGGPRWGALVVTYKGAAAGPPPQQIRPDADNAAGGWTTTPLWSKVDEASPGGDVITGVSS